MKALKYLLTIGLGCFLTVMPLKAQEERYPILDRIPTPIEQLESIHTADNLSIDEKIRCYIQKFGERISLGKQLNGPDHLGKKEWVTYKKELYVITPELKTTDLIAEFCAFYETLEKDATGEWPTLNEIDEFSPADVIEADPVIYIDIDVDLKLEKAKAHDSGRGAHYNKRFGRLDEDDSFKSDSPLEPSAVEYRNDFLPTIEEILYEGLKYRFENLPLIEKLMEESK